MERVGTSDLVLFLAWTILKCLSSVAVLYKFGFKRSPAAARFSTLAIVLIAAQPPEFPALGGSYGMTLNLPSLTVRLSEIVSFRFWAALDASNDSANSLGIRKSPVALNSGLVR